jgi:outer membrane lipoprotein SlyB
MLHSRMLSLAGVVAVATGLAGCAYNDDPYGPNNYPVSDVNPNPAGVALVDNPPATTYYAPATTTYVTPGTTTYVAPAGTTYVAPAATYVAPGTAVVTAAPNTYVVPGSNYVVPAVEYGRVTDVALLSPGTRASGNAAAGAVVGGVVGGALGNQVGHGAGRAAATILGAVTGAAVGSNLASRPSYNYAGPVYRVWVRTDSGVMRTYDVGAYTNLHRGDRVRIDNGAIFVG